MVQSTGFPSITAAAEGPVTFGCFFYRWKARLLSGWGSSSAQGNGGRVRTPAPTMYPKVYLSLRRARCPQRTDSGRPGVPPYGQIGTFRGGRVRTPAPTMYPKVRSIFCRARCPHRADSGRPRCAAPDLGGPRAHSVRPYREKEARRECSLGEGIPPPLRGTPPLTRGALREGDIWGAFSLL